MTVALSDLLPPVTVDDAKAIVLAQLGVPENRVTNWISGAVLRTMVELEALVTSDAAGGGMPGVAGQGFASLAEGDSLTDVARAQWAVDRVLATFCTQTVTLACDAAHGPYLVVAGRNTGTATDGARYVAATGGTINTSSTLTIDMSALSPGKMRGLVSLFEGGALPGVTVVAAAVKVVSGVPQLGSDAEADAEVRAACAARLPDVDFKPAEDRLIAWAKRAVTSTTRYRFDPDAANAGGVLFTVAGAGGAIPGGDVTAIAAYVKRRAYIGDFVTVQNATNATDNAAGVVTVRRAVAPAVMARADAAWVAYNQAVKIGGVVFLTQLTKAVMDAGASNITGQTLNGVADDLVLAATQVPVPGGTLTAQLTWNLI